jgi:hypothetical protein
VYTVTGGGGGGGPTITSILPDSGYPAGGTAVTIIGTGFSGASGATVGGVALTSFVVVNDTTITGTAGAHAAGDADVVVTNGSPGTLTNGFTYLPAGATLDLDADILNLTNGANVDTWTDRSGNGNTATPPLFSPTFATSGINAKRAVTFVGSDELTFASFTAGLTACEVFVVGKHDDDGATSVAFLAFTDDSGGQNLLPFAANRQVYDNAGSDSRQATGFAPATGGWSSPWLYGVIGTASEWTMRFNGTEQYTQASNTFGYGTRRIGKGTVNTYAGKLARVLIYPSKLSGPNRAIVETYLKRKYGIT